MAPRADTCAGRLSGVCSHQCIQPWERACCGRGQLEVHVRTLWRARDADSTGLEACEGWAWVQAVERARERRGSLASASEWLSLRLFLSKGPCAPSIAASFCVLTAGRGRAAVECHSLVQAWVALLHQLNGRPSPLVPSPRPRAGSILSVPFPTHVISSSAESAR